MRRGLANPTAYFWRNRHILYRFYNFSGELLYVGISIDIHIRLGEHRRKTPWFHEVDHMKFRLFPSREAVVAAEREAIRTEHPRYNAMRYLRAIA